MWLNVCSAISCPAVQSSLTREQYGSVSFLIANLKYKGGSTRRRQYSQCAVQSSLTREQYGSVSFLIANQRQYKESSTRRQLQYSASERHTLCMHACDA